MLFSLVTLSFQAVFMKSYCAFLSLFSVSTLSFSSFFFFFCFFMPQFLLLAHYFFKCAWRVRVKSVGSLWRGVSSVYSLPCSRGGWYSSMFLIYWGRTL